MRETGKALLSSSSSRRLTRTFAGITKNVSRSPLARAVPFNTEQVLGLSHKPVQEIRRTPFVTDVRGAKDDEIDAAHDIGLVFIAELKPSSNRAGLST